MARPLRIEFEGAFYHVFSRGIRKENIFFTSRDREVFLKKLGIQCERFQVICHGYVLMDNHYHLIVETPFANLSRFFHALNASYSNWVKAKHQLIGPVFQGRYKAILIEDDSYLLAVSAYIHLNPVRKKMLKKAEEYPWSSLKYFIGKVEKPEWLECERILSFFGQRGGKGYIEYVYGNQGREEDIFQQVQYGFILGSSEFAQEVMEKVKNRKDKLREYSEKNLIHQPYGFDEIISGVQYVYGVEKEEIFKKKRNNEARKMALYLLKSLTPLTLKEIGEKFDMDYAAVSDMVKRFHKSLLSHKKLQKKLEKIKECVYLRTQ